MNERAERFQAWFEWVVLLAAVLVIPVIAIEQGSAGPPWNTIASVANWSIWAVFLTEVAVMLAIVPNRRQWLREHPLDLAIVVLTPPFLPAALQSLRVFRLLRLLRLLRVLQAARRLFSPDGFRWAALLTLITAFSGGAAFAAVEKGHNDKVDGTWDGIWWAVSTMTTVGYGDIYPQTDSGRAIAVVVMIVGIGFLSLLIGVVAQRFVEPEVQEIESEIHDVSEAEADVRAELHEVAERLLAIEKRLGA